MDDDPFLTALKARVDAFAEARNYIMSNIVPNNQFVAVTSDNYPTAAAVIQSDNSTERKIEVQSDDSLEMKIGQVPNTRRAIILRSHSDSLIIAKVNQLEELVRDLSCDCKELLERLQPQPEHIDTNTDESNILNGMEGVL